MAVVTSKQLRVLRLKGKVGDDLTFRSRGNVTFLIRKADMSGVTWTPKQVAQRKRVAAANAWAKEILADAERARPYLRKAKKKARYTGINNPHALLIGEYMAAHPLVVNPET